MEVNSDLITNSTSIIAAVGAVIFGLQKAIKMWSADRGDIQKIGIDTDLYTRLNQELTRLSKTNEEQAEEITELRDKYTALLEEFTQFKVDCATKASLINEMNYRLAECDHKVEALQSENATLRLNKSNGAQ